MNREDYARRLSVGDETHTIYDIQALAADGRADIDRLPFSIKILVENLLRKIDGRVVGEKELMAAARWRKRYDVPVEIPYHPARVLMQDFTGVPAVVDLAAMRDAVARLGGDPRRINPQVPVELVVDHSVQVDRFGTADALENNVALEYRRNGERYALLKWAQSSFENFRVVPPNSGICHQVNLEHLGRGGHDRHAGHGAGVLPGHPGGHRFAHPHDQRHRRDGLGRGRHRGRGRDARPALLHDASRSDRHPPHRGPAPGGDGHRPGTGHHRVAARAQRRGKIRRVLRPGAWPTCRWPTGPPSPT